MDRKLQQLKQQLGEARVRENELMSLHTTFKIGGPAELYIEVSGLDDLVDAITKARKLGVPVFLFGGGSNVIISDNGIKGLVIKNNCRKLELQGIAGKVENQKVNVDKGLIAAESGVIMAQLVRFAVDNSLGGLEYQMGLPGTVGGAIYMNSNFPKKGKYVGDCLKSAKLLTPEGEVKEVDDSYFRFAYDYSILQETHEIVLSAVFELTSGDKKVLWEMAMEALNYRNASQPKGASAGCTFRNFSIADAMRIPTPENTTSAGYLIDQAGLKGKQVGGAMISDMHANFILNKGNAKAADIVGLVDLMKSEVKKKFGVELALEVKTVGF